MAHPTKAGQLVRTISNNLGVTTKKITGPEAMKPGYIKVMIHGHSQAIWVSAHLLVVMGTTEDLQAYERE